MSATCVKTTCPYCGVGCGIEVTAETPEQIKIVGDEEHPSNLGRLCSKGLALGETIDMSGRLLHPEINGERVSWDQAINQVADRFSQIVDQHGPDAVAFYVSGQLLTEDYYVANKLIKGFIGTGNIDTNSRLCMSSAVVGYKRAFGMDAVPTCYEDIEQAELFVITGSNMAWCHPVLFQRLRAAKLANPAMKVVVIDPRRTSSCDIADIHLPLNPGTDATLFNGLLLYLAFNKALDDDYIAQYTEGFQQSLEAAKQSLLAETGQAEIANADELLSLVADNCGVQRSDLLAFYDAYRNTPKAITFYSMGINQSSSGSDKANSIINCHLATGRVGKSGAGPFSITGQPNAMGGREVGGLANQLAAHMDFGKVDNNGNEHTEIVSEFWQAKNMAQANGLMALDMFEAVEQGEIKAIWIMATNPVVSLPDANRWKRALENCDFVVVSDCMKDTDTAQCANVLLPATGWGEKNGTVTNSERRISRQRPFRAPAGEARHDWQIMTEVAHAMGFANDFPYQHPADIFREHAALSGYKNNGTRDFDISALGDIHRDDYDALTPLQWPLVERAAHVNTVDVKTADVKTVDVKDTGTKRLFTDNRFFTLSGKAQFLAITPRLPVNPVSSKYPLVLNTGRIRDQWHTMTRTGKSSRLSSHLPEPFAHIHPDDAKDYAIADGSLVAIESQWGKVIVRAELTDAQQRGQVFVPMHWTAQYASMARVDAVVNPEVDPFSAQPEFKHTPVTLAAYQAKWYGFILSHDELALPEDTYLIKNKGKGFWRYELAGDDLSKRPLDLINEAQWLTYTDAARNSYRGALIDDGRLKSVIFISEQLDLPSRAWLASLFDQQKLDASARRSLLAGKPMDASNDIGEIICSCFGVGKNTIQKTIAEKKLCTPEEIGVCLKAGTNCGSCVPELRNLLEKQPDKGAA